MKQGEDVRNSKWFKRFTDRLITDYVRMKKDTFEEIEYVKAEIWFVRRRGKLIVPHWFVFTQEKGEEIDVKMEDDI